MVGLQECSMEYSLDIPNLIRKSCFRQRARKFYKIQIRGT